MGDFNADGKLDLAVSNSWSNNVSILIGVGDGRFNLMADYHGEAGPFFVAMGDFNADVMPDLAVANQGSDNISIFTGVGDGTFNSAVNYAVGLGPVSLAVGDFNADRKPDLAVANAYSENVSILTGSGDGTFNTAVSYAAGAGPYCVAVGDFDADGMVDLAVPNSDTTNLSVLLNALAVPTVTTQAVSSIGDTTATGNGRVVSDGGSAITERGIVWNTAGMPTTADHIATASGTTGAFAASISGLTAGTVYHVRAYATNAVGTSYGSEVTFNIGWMPFTPVEGAVTETPTTAGGTTTVNVSITFSSAGYRVDDWGVVTKVGEDYRVDAIVSRWTGPSFLKVSSVSHGYVLGTVTPGSHNFKFYGNGTLVKTTPFVISASTMASSSIGITGILVAGTPAAGKAVLVQMVVENRGKTKDSFTVELFADGKTVGTVAVKNLLPGTSRKLYLRWIPAMAGDVPLAAAVVRDGVSMDGAPGARLEQKVIVRK